VQGIAPAGFGAGPAAPRCADWGFEGGGTPPHQREWSGQGEALSWPREYAGEEFISKGIVALSERVQVQTETWRSGARLAIIPKRLGFC